MKNKTCAFGVSGRKLFFVIILAIILFSAFSQEIGLVLNGGGGKGAYEVGVWQALKEYGIAQKVTVISGTSVGGLNAALFAVADMDTILYIWRYLVPQYLVKTDYLVFNISQEGLYKIIDMLPLGNLYNSYPLVNVTCVRDRYKLLKYFGSAIGIIGPGGNAHRFWLNVEKDVNEIQKMLLATSAIPIIMNSIELKDGYWYSDGGEEGAGGDNLPIDGILNSADNGGVYKYRDKIDTIYVVYLEQTPKRRIKIKNYDKYNIVEIIPSIDLGWVFDGTLNFTPERINLLIKYGYDDTVKILRAQGLYPVSDYWFK